MTDEKVVEITGTETSPEEKTTPAEAKKKRNYKLHFLLLVALGAGTWAFWSYSPLAAQWKNTLLPNFKVSFEQPLQPQPQQTEPTPTAPVQEEDDAAEPTESLTQEPELDTSPTFEPNYDLNLENNTEPKVSAESFDADFITAMQSMQQQLDTMQQTITHMQAQQLQLNQQQVRAQLFASLQQAASSQATLRDMMTAWKSISFMPMLHEDKRTFADQAYTDLQSLEQNIQNISQEIHTLITTLAQQLNPKDMSEVADAVEEVVDTSNNDAFYSSLDWLKEQFVISKVDKHALNISDDPYADIKALMNNLHQLKQQIQNRDWSNITNLNAIRYQLEQRGMETTLSADILKQLEESQQTWQNEAQTWMEQL